MQVSTAIHPKAATKVMNQTQVLPGVDGRSLMARRVRELSQQMVSDCGGDVTQTRLAIIMRACVLLARIEQAEAAALDGRAELEPQAHVLMVNCARRLLCDIGLERVARDVTPNLDRYIRQTAA